MQEINLQKSTFLKSVKSLVVLILILLISSAFFAVSVKAQTFTLINDTLTTMNMTFTMSIDQNTFYVTLPKGIVNSASLKFAGFATKNGSDTTTSVMMVTDVSLSMNDMMGTKSKIAWAKDADYLFVNTINTSFTNMGLVSYSTCPTYNLNVRPLTTNKVSLNNTIRNYNSEMSTNIGKGLMLAIDELLKTSNSTKYILLMTDGMANQYPSGFATGAPYPYGNSCSSGANYANSFVLNQANRAKDNNIKIYSIGFGSNVSDINQTLLSNVSNLTSGEYFYAPTGNKLLELYATLVGKMADVSYPAPYVSSDIWRANQVLVGNATWSNSDCGLQGASCADFKNWIQQQIDACPTATGCVINFTISSNTQGILALSNLNIDITPMITSNCNKPTCDTYLTNYRNGIIDVNTFNSVCGDENITVYNPSLVRIHEIYSDLSPIFYSVNSFSTINPAAFIGSFSVDPISGAKNQVYRVFGTGVNEGAKSVGVIKINIQNYPDTIRFCPILIKNSFNPLVAQDIPSDFLVTGSRAVIGFRDEDGVLVTQGPFIFTAKVWLRK